MGNPITSADIATLLQRDLTTLETAAADLYIELAVGELEAWLGRPVGAESFDEVVYPDADGAVYFKNTPVISVESFTVNGSTYLTETSPTIFGYGLENIWELTWPYLTYDNYTVSSDGVYGGAVTVSYTAGLDWRSGLRSVVLNAVTNRIIEDVGRAAREANGTVGVKSLTIEEYTIAYERTGSGSSTSHSSSLTIFPNPDVDFKSIARYKRLGSK